MSLSSHVNNIFISKSHGMDRLFYCRESRSVAGNNKTALRPIQTRPSLTSICRKDEQASKRPRSEPILKKKRGTETEPWDPSAAVPVSR